MREILFRGKRTDNHKWIEGTGIFNDGVNTWIFANEPNRAIAYGMEHYIVNPETVGQYTGLTDKNGKKIFEGDILTGVARWLERMKNGIVAFRDGSFGVIWYRGDVEQFNAFTSMCNVEYEVIGNTHDSPELLKGE